MNTNPDSVKVVCYGDSNTWGKIPSSGERYPAFLRWTGVLQNLLGNEYEIIEEGLPGRTTVFDPQGKTERNGKTYLIPCLKSHNPFDIFILNLGTNDFQNFSFTAKEVSKNVEELIGMIQEFGLNKQGDMPTIILTCPPMVDDSVKYIIDQGLAGATERIKSLPKEIENLSQKYGIDYVNLQESVRPSLEDGCHLSIESHKKIGEVLFQKIVSIFCKG
jgi:lysophospholipase L1-like esterase